MKLKAVPIVLLLLLLGAGAGQVMASHDPGIIHACIKNGSIQIVSSPADCKTGETPVALATEDALQTRLDTLETLVKRLHGNQAAVISRSGNGNATGTPGFLLVSLYFCDPTDLGPQDVCDADHGYAIESGPINGTLSGSTLTFDASNTPDFPAIAAYLTDGKNEIIRISEEYHQADGTWAGGGSSSGYDRAWFFGTPQVSSGPHFSDLTGLPIDSISLSLDFVLLDYDTNSQSTGYYFDYRVFFGLAH